MTPRRLLWILGSAALAAVLVIGLIQAGGSSGDDEAPVPSLAEARERLQGAPAPLAALHADANRLVAASPSDLEATLRRLRGHPVVINQWASWCGPCRLEFPVFQRLSAELGREVAFLGLDSKDHDAEAKRFLAAHPVSYPSFADPDVKAARSVGAGLSWPTTVFYDKSGTRTYVKQGQYADDDALRADVERYALGR